MSHITNTLIFASYVPQAVEGLIEQPLPFDDREQSFRRLDTGPAGGSKVFTSDLYAAAFNYVGTSDIQDWFAALPWGTAGAAALITSEEGSTNIVTTLGWEGETF
jgi:hypothetical protein